MVAVTTLPSPLYTDVNMLVIQTAGIPFIGQRSFGHKSALGLSYLFSVFRIHGDCIVDIIIWLVRFFILTKFICIYAGIHSYMLTHVGTPTFD